MGCVIGKNLGDDQTISMDGIDIILNDKKQTKEDKEVENIKKQIEKYPEMFILNNLLMCFVFFKNYVTDFYDFSNTNIPKEEQMLDVELKTQAKKSILPNILIDKIQKNIKFLREHIEENKDGKETENITTIHEEYLTPKIMYMVHNNIEVTVADNGNEYTPIAVPGCSVVVEEIMKELGGRNLVLEGSKEPEKTEKFNKHGFLRLRVTANSSKNIGKQQLVDRKEYKPQHTDVVNPGTSKEYLTKDLENEEYSEIIAFNTPKNINIRPTNGRRETLPNDCFQRRKIKKINEGADNKMGEGYDIEFEDDDYETSDSDEDEETDEEQEDNKRNNDEQTNNEETKKAENRSEGETKDEKDDEEKGTELFEEITYLSSKGFLEYFQSEVFPNAVGTLLGFTEKQIENSQLYPGYIICDKEGDNQYKIIPAVPIDWPLQAKEFTNRKTRKLYDRKNNKYEWPTESMVQELKGLNCVVIPKGFVDKKDVNNPDSEIEWEIHFPKTERFLEMRLAHAQVKCYIFLISLFKTFIEKVTSHRGLVMEHLRTHLFWECEKDAMSWPEHKMGIKILNVIEDLNSGLSKRNIPDFFIKNKNIFENIPSMYIQFAQKIFHDVLQFPVMHFLEALKNLKYVQEDFYPVPDLDELEYLLISEEVLQPKKSSLHPRKNKKVKAKRKKKIASRQISPKDTDLDWKILNERLNRKKHLKEMKRKKAQEAKNTKVMGKNRNLKISFEHLDILRQRELLQYFIKHFIAISKKSREIGPLNQSRFYIDRARCNWRVLVELVGSSNDTNEIERAINEEENEIENMLEKSSAHVDIAPPTPRRNKGPTASSFNISNSEKIALTPKLYIRSVSDSRSKMKDKELVKEKRVKSVAFDDNVEVSAC
ncbi:hypothetical protein WA026_021397 [Henosepilachna vigintioctopunctata]|uniref:Mab-21-like HhH/H2TH-like domain-containing protein n=1 Tax=Henosepilachna vigintioctopunctata TaxID=420089 RepID=A0AAW1TX42_9CUCU